MRIGEKRIDLNSPCFIIAEAGVNHNGNLKKAFQLVDKAKEAEADAIKFQIFVTENLVTPLAPKAEYQVSHSSAAETQFEMLKDLELSFEDHKKIFSYCKQKGILYLATPFEVVSAEFLFELGTPAIKVSSGDLTNLPFLKFLANQKKPLIVSTGMATMFEVDEAVTLIRNQGNEQIVLLHCVSDYPASPKDANLRAMDAMANAFNLLVGFSDHTLGTGVGLAAIARGAKVIEKHFTLDKTLPGPDHKASLDPDELKQFVRDIRMVESTLGSGIKEPTSNELPIAMVVRKSLVAAKTIRRGEKILESMISIKRPGSGLAPGKLQEILGKVAEVEIAEGTILALDMLR